MQKIDYEKFKGVTGEEANLELAHEILDGFEPDNPPMLSEIIANEAVGGLFLQQALAQRERDSATYHVDPFKWKLLVLCDEFGEPVLPGQKVVRHVMKPGRRKFTTEDMTQARIDGTYLERFMIKLEFPVDDRGCITCGFSDALYFLLTYGINYKSKKRITSRREKSRQPRKMRDGSMKVIHYWRYTEPPMSVYNKLPSVAPSKK